MATLLTVADVLELVETDLPDSVLQRYLDAAEEDVREYVTSDERKTLPAIVWSGSFTPDLGEAEVELTLSSALNAYPRARFEGTVADDGAHPTFRADTLELEKDESGADTLTPLLTSKEITIPASDAYLVNPRISATDITEDTAIADTGDGPRIMLLEDFESTGPILPDVTFFTEWEGSIVIEVSSACNLEVRLHTKHAFGPAFGKEFDHVRSHYFDITANRRESIALNVFDSVSTVRLGTYTPPGADPIEITAADMDGPSRITYELEFRSHPRRDDTTRNANTLEYVHFENAGTVSFQMEGRTARKKELVEDAPVSAGTFGVSLDDTGKTLTLDTTQTRSAITLTRILGMQSGPHPVKFVQAVLDLVQLEVIRRGVENERVGQYSISPADYHKERGKVLTRLAYASGESLVS